ncbi:unnamed protein product [Brassicogethes aeneus]|uniref:Single domain-containing protein n=1 Tax=Brassicogethes aeneus TaxID=1431903 RepID=A0A9P0B8X6_BRAAE|nr:unnamed protein product [Brassicogethes aeneus]
MKSFILLVILSCLLATAFGANEGHCYSEATGRLEYNQVQNLKNCQQALCNEDGTIDTKGCPELEAGDRELVQDDTKDFPECCPTV